MADRPERPVERLSTAVVPQPVAERPAERRPPVVEMLPVEPRLVGLQGLDVEPPVEPLTPAVVRQPVGPPEHPVLVEFHLMILEI